MVPVVLRRGSRREFIRMMLDVAEDGGRVVVALVHPIHFVL